jgi:hypothetical protein
VGWLGCTFICFAQRVFELTEETARLVRSTQRNLHSADPRELHNDSYLLLPLSCQGPIMTILLPKMINYISLVRKTITMVMHHFLVAMLAENSAFPKYVLAPSLIFFYLVSVWHRFNHP